MLDFSMNIQRNVEMKLLSCFSIYRSIGDSMISDVL